MAGDNIFFSLAGPLGDYTGPILCFFAGFFLYFILQKEERSCDEQVGGRGALYFLVCRIAYQGAMDEARGGEYYISKPLLYRYTPLAAA
jgi:hypothetical protein